MWLEVEFRWKWDDYNEVIALIESGELQPDDSGLTRLPPEYLYLTVGGDIIIDTSDVTLSVFFFTFRGVMDNFSGYMYRANNTPPDDVITDWTQIQQKRPYWFFCSSS
jgi:hypothetical protein